MCYVEQTSMCLDQYLSLGQHGWCKWLGFRTLMLLCVVALYLLISCCVFLQYNSGHPFKTASRSVKSTRSPWTHEIHDENTSPWESSVWSWAAAARRLHWHGGIRCSTLYCESRRQAYLPIQSVCVSSTWEITGVGFPLHCRLLSTPERKDFNHFPAQAKIQRLPRSQIIDAYMLTCKARCSRHHKDSPVRPTLLSEMPLINIHHFLASHINNYHWWKQNLFYRL